MYVDGYNKRKWSSCNPPTSIDLGNGHHTKGTKNKKGGNDPIGELQEKLLIRKKAGFVELDLVD